MINQKRLGVFVGIFLFSLTLANACTINVELINQDPYPVIPGENVKLMFQVTGVENKECGEVGLKIIENFPFTVDPSMSSKKSIQSGTFVRDYSAFWMVPFNLRVEKNAKEGNNELEVLISTLGKESGIVKKFDIEVKEVRTDFEVFVREYDKVAGTITFNIINVGKNGVEALVIEIPEQESLSMAGSNIQTIGIIDSNEDTTSRFKVSGAKKGEIILSLRYNDITNERREIIKVISFDPSLFNNQENGKGLWNTTTKLIFSLALIIVAYFIYTKYKRKKFLKKRNSLKF